MLGITLGLFFAAAQGLSIPGTWYYFCHREFLGEVLSPSQEGESLRNITCTSTVYRGQNHYFWTFALDPVTSPACARVFALFPSSHQHFHFVGGVSRYPCLTRVYYTSLRLLGRQESRVQEVAPPG